MVHHLLEETEHISVGESSYYNGIMKRKGRGQITVGSYCAFGENLHLIAGNNHNYNYAAIQVAFYRKHFPTMRYPGHSPPIGIRIGSDVWIGDNVTILDGADIGHGCIVGAGAVVPGKEYDNYSIIGGVPARIIKARFPEYVKQALLGLRWWEKSSEWISSNPRLFCQDLSSLTHQEVDDLVASCTSV